MKKEVWITVVILFIIIIVPVVAINFNLKTTTKDKAEDGHVSISLTTSASSSISETVSTSTQESTEQSEESTEQSTSSEQSTSREESVVVEPTTKNKNNEIISTIKNRYGFDVKYGDGTYCYYAGGSCVALYDDNRAYTFLVELQKFLTHFPDNFFRAFQGYNGYHIELMDDIPGNTAGYASYEMPGDNVMYLDVNTSFPNRVFYHETWHLVEELMSYRNNFNETFTNWDSYNPEGFTYGDSSNNDYTIYDDSENANYFISAYGKTNAHEDRAEVFADLMFRSYKREYMVGSKINEKAKRMALEMRNIWGNNGYAWERWITW